MTHHIIPGSQIDQKDKATSDALDQIAIDAYTQGFGVALHNIDGTITRIDPDVFRSSQIDPSQALPHKTHAQHQERAHAEIPDHDPGLAVQGAAIDGNGRGMAGRAMVGTLVDDVLALFSACGFEVRTDNPRFAILGSTDSAGILVDSVIEHFACRAVTQYTVHDIMASMPAAAAARTSVDNVQDVLVALDRLEVVRMAAAGVERRRAAPAPADIDVTEMALDWYDQSVLDDELTRDNFHMFALKLAEGVELAGRCRAPGSNTKPEILTPVRIKEIAEASGWVAEWTDRDHIAFARAIEREVSARLAATTQASTAQAEPTEWSDAQREAARDALSAELGSAMDCTRVWSAWRIGTMSEGDFHLLGDNDERLDDLVGVVEAAILGAPVTPDAATSSTDSAPTCAEAQAEEAKLYRDLTGDAMALGFDGVPAALEALRKDGAAQAEPACSAELVQLRAQNMLLVGLYDAVAKLVKAKGRFHTEQNYGALVAAFDLVRTADTPAATTSTDAQAAAEVRDAALLEAMLICDLRYEARVKSGHPREASTARALSDEINAIRAIRSAGDTGGAR